MLQLKFNRLTVFIQFVLIANIICGWYGTANSLDCVDSNALDTLNQDFEESCEIQPVKSYDQFKLIQVRFPDKAILTESFLETVDIWSVENDVLTAMIHSAELDSFSKIMSSKCDQCELKIIQHSVQALIEKEKKRILKSTAKFEDPVSFYRFFVHTFMF